jgi:hypothetical protein
MTLDHINLALILGCCMLAYVLPFELVLLSYAILGPAHYLTQINWMHQRKYFTPNLPFLMPASVAVFVALVFPQWGGAALFTAVALAVISLLPVKQGLGWLLAALACGLYLLLNQHFSVLQLAFFVLLPTVIHVFVFTGLFMVSGAVRARSGWGLVAVAALVGCGALFFIVPPSTTPLLATFVAGNTNIFGSILTHSGKVFGFTPSPQLMASFMAFLSFAYTYHYLNWFSKAGVIHWHNATPQAWALMGLCYVGAVGLYFYNYELGFTVLLFLSLLHVVLELPLNARTLRDLPTLLFNRQRLAL